MKGVIKMAGREDPLKNGLSLEFTKAGGKWLVLNDEILPGQCAIKIEKPNKWGVREVMVHFEVFDEKELNKEDLLGLKERVYTKELFDDTETIIKLIDFWLEKNERNTT